MPGILPMSVSTSPVLIHLPARGYFLLRPQLLTHTSPAMGRDLVTVPLSPSFQKEIDSARVPSPDGDRS
jgi:hypothetical protein